MNEMKKSEVGQRRWLKKAEWLTLKYENDM